MSFVTIRVIIDVASALETQSLENCLFMFDNRRLAGSTGEKTNQLCTVVSPGEQIMWTVMPFECEAYVALKNICFEGNDLFEAKERSFENTNVHYWELTTPKPPPKDAANGPAYIYSMEFDVGDRNGNVELKVEGPSLKFLTLG